MLRFPHSFILMVSSRNVLIFMIICLVIYVKLPSLLRAFPRFETRLGYASPRPLFHECPYLWVLHILIFVWPFLPLLSPLTRHNEQLFSGLPEVSVVQNPHAHCANYQNHYVMERVVYRPICSFRYPFGSLVCPTMLAHISHRHLTMHNVFCWNQHKNKTLKLAFC